MSETVFIFGAGASAQAGAPVVREFLDQADRLLRAGQLTRAEDREAFELVARGRAALDAVYAKASIDSDDLEAVFGAFEMAALFRQPIGALGVEDVRRLPEAIRQVIIRTLEELVVFPVRERPATRDRGALPGVVRPPAPYNQFLDIVKGLQERRESFSIITFNYDLALDFALLSAGNRVEYGLPINPMEVGQPDILQKNPGQPTVALFKLHGSLHWAPCTTPTCPDIVAGDLEALAGWKNEPEAATRRLRVSASMGFCPRCQSKSGDPRPVIVPPTWNKNDHHQGVGSVWRHAAERLRKASRIVVVGYSLPSTDQFFRYLYALGSVGDTRLQQFLVVNPDARVERRFRRLLGRGVERRFEFRQWEFGPGMQSLAALLLEGRPWIEVAQPGRSLEKRTVRGGAWGR